MDFDDLDILAGPALRKTDRNVVNIWLATTRPHDFSATVNLLDRSGNAGEPISVVSVTERIKLGEKLFVHMISVGARTNSAKRTLRTMAEQRVDRPNLQQIRTVSFNTENVVIHDSFPADLFEATRPGFETTRAGPRRAFPPETRLTYVIRKHNRPSDIQVPFTEDVRSATFQELSLDGLALSQDDNRPQFVLQNRSGRVGQEQRSLFASCRKLHGHGWDATNAMLVYARAKQSDDKQHHNLFLGGDQIYADDVSADIIAGLALFSALLIGKTEFLPLVETSPLIGNGARGSYLENGVPGGSAFTSGEKENHLLRFGDYAAMHCMAWNDANWLGRNLPTNLSSAILGSDSIRRLMANIPTYMMFDDHDVTDDWNLNVELKARQRAHPIGKLILTNAISAFWAFQGWGNHPEEYSYGGGLDLKQRIIARCAAISERRWNSRNVERILDFNRWSFAVPNNPPTVFFNTRTTREDDEGRMRLVSDREYQRLIRLVRRSSPTGNRSINLMIPVPMFGAPVDDLSQEITSSVPFFGPTFLDFESFRSNLRNYRHIYQFFRALNSRGFPLKHAVVMSGDVHFAYFSEGILSASSNEPQRAVRSRNGRLSRINGLIGIPMGDADILLTQLVSSALKNENNAIVRFIRDNYNASSQHAQVPLAARPTGKNNFLEVSTSALGDGRFSSRGMLIKQEEGGRISAGYIKEVETPI